MTISDAARSFLDLSVRHVDVGTARLAYREVGEGPPLLLIHGWPLWGFTWRHVLPELSRRHRCVVVDLAGAGDSTFDEHTRFGFGDHAAMLRRFVDEIGLDHYAVMAHDSGGTVARELALLDPHRVTRLVLMGTEIPNHRPPLVEMLQSVFRFRVATEVFRLLIGSRRYLRSRWGFGGCFSDPSYVDGEFHDYIVKPLREDRRKLDGQIRYALGIDWEALDALEEGHRRIHQPVLFVWGRRDPFFPPEDARVMESQMANCAGFHVIEGRLFIHEDRADALLAHAAPFLAEDAATPTSGRAEARAAI